MLLQDFLESVPRVVGANGTLTGYAGGVDRKQTLLDPEQDALF